MPRKSSTKASSPRKRKPNWANRTVFQCDDLEALWGMDTETVDLIVTEVPRAKAADFHAAPERIHKETSFQDRWAAEEDIHQTCMEEIQGKLPAAWQAIDAAQAIHGSSMGAFLCFMGLRLIEMHRVLRPTGSIYLHCDHLVSHCLRLLADAVFDKNNFRNEIAWCYRGNANTKKAFPKRHDTLLFYARSKDATFHPQYIPYSAEKRRAMQTGRGDRSRINRLLERGVPVPDWWDDIIPVRRALPLIQPVALYERVIRASSSEGDMVLDPFCRHPLIIMAAENLGRQWVAIDPLKHPKAADEADMKYSEEPPERTDG